MILLKPHCSPFRFPVLLAALLLAFSGPVHAEQQTPPAPPSAPEKAAQKKTVPAINAVEVEKKIQALKEKLAASEAAETEETAARLNVPLARLQEQSAHLRELAAVYQRQLTSLKRQTSLKNEEAGLSRKLESRQESLIAQPPPYNLSFYDSLLDQLAGFTRQEQTLSITLKSVKKGLEEAKTRAVQAAQQVREREEAIERKNRGKKSLQLSRELEFAKVEEELAQAELDLQRLAVDNGAAELRLDRLNKKISRRHADWVRPQLAFDQEDLDKHLEALAERRAQLQNRIDTLRRDQQDIENAWLTARKEFDQARGAEESAKATAAAFLEAREAWRDTYQKVLEQSGGMLVILNQEELVWQRRYALLGRDADYRQLDGWQRESAGHLDNINRISTAKESDQSNLQTEIAATQKQLGQEGLDPAVGQHVKTRLSALNKLADRNFEYLTLLKGARAIEQRFLDEHALFQKDIAVKRTLHSLWAKIQDVWDLELWVVDERAVTVRKVVMALFILTVGLLLAGWFSRRVIRRLLSHTRLDDSAAAAAEKLFYFLALLALLVFALSTVNIPLAVFTFLGGAIAIGIGFGAKNLLNNFISGFILLAERPVKINDMIEVDDDFGIIEEIGIRCTRIRTPGNVHILVPNSSFLEKNIINWTLSDQEIRAKVTVGVAYDADPGEAARLMRQAADEHLRILRTPEPVVLLDDLGDNAFTLCVYFWIVMRSMSLMERRIIESDVRFRVMELFRAAGIEIALPQRDVHLNTASPLDLRLLTPQTNAEATTSPRRANGRPG